MTEPSKEAVDAVARARYHDFDTWGNGSKRVHRYKIRKDLEAALPIELEKACQRWEQEVRERLEKRLQKVIRAREGDIPMSVRNRMNGELAAIEEMWVRDFGEAEPVEGDTDDE